MTSSRSQRLKDLFEQAVELDDAARVALLDRACADDAGLRQELLELLAADTGAAALALESAMAMPSAELPRPGQLIAGRYRIVRQIGEGGMGIVFEAEQQEPRRRVALKCIRTGALDPLALQRFRREAYALGQLQHPGIAQVFEAGLHEGPPPLPFLAMELVEGQPLGDAARGLPLRDQLALLAALAEAVAHAHERGIVHRDLKPSNVLVETGSAGPRPRVLDFGIARLHGEPGATSFTRTNQVIGTLAYLSPEQIEHGSNAADPRSDVWSLGVIAYELLSGRPPLPLREAALAEAARLLRDEEPTRLDRLVPALRGDLSTIVHKALSKDPGQRYPDAGALAADLRRLLADQPIAARPPSTLYQLQRFARRHRGLVAGLATTFVVLVAGLVVAIVLAARAATERDRATERTTALRSMLRTLLADVDRELATVPGAIGARGMLLRAGQQHAEGMAQDALQGDDAKLLLEVTNLFEVLADVQGQPGEANLGDLDGSLQSLGRAMELTDRAIAIAPDWVPARRTRVRLFSQQDGLLRALGRREQREQALLEQEREAERVLALAKDRDTERDLVLAIANRARFLAESGQLEQALPGMIRARDFLRSDWQQSGDRDHLHSVCSLGMHIGNLHRRLGQLPAARTAYDDTVTLARQAKERYADRDADRNLATMLREHGVFHLRTEQPDAALPLLEEAVALLAPMAQAEPADLDLATLLRGSQTVLADALQRTGRVGDARRIAERALADLLALVAAHPGHPTLRRELLPMRHLLVRIAGRAGDAETAAQQAALALEQARAARAAEPGSEQTGDDVLSSLAMAALAPEMRALADGLEPSERAQRRREWIAALQAQRAWAEELAAIGQLPPSRGRQLEELRARIVQLEAEGTAGK
ncbi:MAG: serine/threonine protein kinase [Planctomycetes bacterium]|nr:serine/threonine protein kinase [Planctomycetota bacterium]